MVEFMTNQNDTMHILVADDSSTYQKIFQALLSEWGFHVIQAKDGNEALRIYQEGNGPLLALVDWEMPGMNGVELCQQIRQMTSIFQPYVIMVTTKEKGSDKVHALDSGADDFIPKPFNEEELQARLNVGKRTIVLQHRLTQSLSKVEHTMQEQQKTEGQLRKALAETKGLVASISMILIEIDNAGQVQKWNKSAEQTFNMSSSSMIGNCIGDLNPKLWDWPQIMKAILVCEEQNSPQTLNEVSFMRPSGHDGVLRVSLNPLFTDSGIRFGLLLLGEDITDRRQTQKSLEKAHAENQELLSAISAILIGVDKQGRVKKWNQVAEETFGISFAGVRGQPFRLCGLKWDWDRIIESMETCRRQMTAVHLDSIRYERCDNREGFVSFTMNPIMGDFGEKELRGVLLFGRDITEKQLMERQLLQAQKLESIGQLAAGVAHEINTPIQFLGDNARFLHEAFNDLQKVLNVCTEQVKGVSPEDEEVQKIQSTIEEVDLIYLTEEIPKAISQSLGGIERVATIVRAMKEFSHPGTAEKTSIDLNQAIQNTITVARNEWKYVAEVDMDLDPTLPFVPCLPGEFNQVILNLLINAAHAIGAAQEGETGDKGRITITTRKSAEGVEIRVTDTGTGIPEEAQKKIFDPFFTTKEVGKGTGQGLAIAHDMIVNKHGGTMTFETELGKGTTFHIRLPLQIAAGNRE